MIIMIVMGMFVMVIMLFFGMVVMAVFPMFFMGMLVVIMVIMAVMISVIMGIERATFPEGTFDEAMASKQRHGFGICGNGFNRFFQEGLQFMSDPENDIRILQAGGLGGFQAVGMGR